MMKQVLTALTAFFLVFSSYGQGPALSIDRNEKNRVIDSLSILLTNYYIFPEKTPPTVSLLKNNFKKGLYDKYSDPREFADRITADVISITNDKHFRIAYDPESVMDERTRQTTDEASTSENDKVTNFGFDQVKILNGNIGYINLTAFHDLKYSAEVLNAAMTFLKNTNAIVIDLRNNHGGASDLGPYFSGFFFNDEQLLYDFYSRENNRELHKQYWTSVFVNGLKFPDMDVYILTGNFTFSAAEAFSYSMQSLKRATIVGENSGGGAHMWTGKIVTKNFYAHIPYARPVDPRTKTNWEITGVIPDIKCEVNQSLVVAQIKALETLRAKDTANSALYEWQIEGLQSQLKAVTISEQKLISYAGEYGNITISYMNGKLFFDWRGTKNEMIPLSEDYFLINEFNFFRIKMVEVKGNVTAIKIVNDDRTEREYKRTK